MRAPRHLTIVPDINLVYSYHRYTGRQHVPRYLHNRRTDSSSDSPTKSHQKYRVRTMYKPGTITMLLVYVRVLYTRYRDLVQHSSACVNTSYT